jgi:hypothetical protein
LKEEHQAISVKVERMKIGKGMVWAEIQMRIEVIEIMTGKEDKVEEMANHLETEAVDLKIVHI